MLRRFPPSIDQGHPDYETLNKIKAGIVRRSGLFGGLEAKLPLLLKEAVDFVLDPVRTARTDIRELDKVEKAFIGLKIEHYLRDILGVPKGLKRDLQLDGLEIDIKNTIGTSWMIPPETYRNAEPCLLIASAKFDGRCWLGIVLAKAEYLTSEAGQNRDKKRQLSASGKNNILWIVEDAQYPVSSFAGIDMDKFRSLRSLKGGKKRAAEFFRSNIGMKVNRVVVQALLFDQKDYMKRVRENGGARDILKKEGISLLSGVWSADVAKAAALGIALEKDEFISCRAEYFVG